MYIKSDHLWYNLFQEGESYYDKKRKFYRTNRASTDRISSIEISLPSIEEQNRIINGVSKFEKQIEEYKKKKTNLQERKNKIVKELLNIK